MVFSLVTVAWVLRPCFQEYCERAAPFQVICESVSSGSMEFLDATVSISLTGRIVVGPNIRSTAIQTPLAFQSGHPPHIHRSWPRAMASRYTEKCSSGWERRTVLEELAHRFRASHAHKSASIVLNSLSKVCDDRIVPRRGEERPVVWFPLLYTPAGREKSSPNARRLPVSR